MPQCITSGDQCTLYDSVTGLAYGPVFANHYIAKQFVRFVESTGIENGDMRGLTDAEIENYWASWCDFCANG